MDDWKYDPAHDLGLSEGQRLRSIRRESGLAGLLTRNIWWLLVREYFRIGQHVTVQGRENLPAAPPFMLVANHASHLDALLLLACQLPLKLRTCVFPIAAGDTFFETPVITAFAAGAMNALPLWRKNAGHHAMEDLRQRLVHQPCGYILFPEGTHRALPPGRRFPRRTKIILRIGHPLNFAGAPNNRDGWSAVAAGLQAAVRELAIQPKRPVT